MKYIFFCVLTILIITRCTKENPIVTPDPVEPTHLIGLDSMMFKRNGSLIKVKGKMYFYNNGNTYWGMYSRDRIIAGHSLSERLSVSKIPFSVGRYNIGKPGLFDLSVLPYARISWSVEDVIVGELETVDSFPDDYIEVIEADTVAKTVEGRFQFHLINIESQYLEEYGLPDSLNITEGVFYLKLQ